MPVTLEARELMDTQVLKIDSQTSVLDALRKMIDSNTWSFIVEKQGQPVGVVTERDILRRCVLKQLQTDKVKVEEIMSSPLITIGPESHVGEIMDKMIAKAIRRVYVSENGKIIGRITQTMLFENSLNVMESLSALKQSP